MRRIAIAVLLMASASGAGAQGLSPEGVDASTKYQACMKAYAAKLDDGRSDAASIGLGVVPMCAVERRNFAVVSSHGSFELQAATQRAMDEKAHALATSYVLVLRAAKAKPAAPAPKAKPKGEGI